MRSALLQSLPSRASVTRVDFGHPADLAFAPSVRFAVLCQLPTSRLKQQGRQGGRLAVLSGSGDVFVSAVIGPEQVRRAMLVERYALSE
jgi:hypothetical protein